MIAYRLAALVGSMVRYQNCTAVGNLWVSAGEDSNFCPTASWMAGIEKCEAKTINSVAMCMY